MEFRFDTILYSRLGNENSDAGHIKCSRGPIWPADRRFPTAGIGRGSVRHFSQHSWGCFSRCRGKSWLYAGWATPPPLKATKNCGFHFHNFVNSSLMFLQSSLDRLTWVWWEAAEPWRGPEAGPGGAADHVSVTGRPRLSQSGCQRHRMRTRHRKPRLLSKQRKGNGRLLVQFCRFFLCIFQILATYAKMSSLSWRSSSRVQEHLAHLKLLQIGKLSVNFKKWRFSLLYKIPATATLQKPLPTFSRSGIRDRQASGSYSSLKTNILSLETISFFIQRHFWLLAAHFMMYWKHEKPFPKRFSAHCRGGFCSVIFYHLDYSVNKGKVFF